MAFPTALATAVGSIIAGSVLLTAQTGFGAGEGVFAWAILIAYVLMLAQPASFGEAALLGSVSSLQRRLARLFHRARIDRCATRADPMVGS